MNPLTQVKRTQAITSKEAALGLGESASWHAGYKHSAYVFVGGLPFDLTEGDLLAVFAQYGEIVDVNLVRDKGTGKSKGFAFLAYEDQRSTVLAVDNLNGTKVLGRILRVDHVSNYKKKEEEDEEKEREKREARGVCRSFQRGECTRGASCKFSHDERRAQNTGWGPKDSDSRWTHDKHDDGPPKSHKSFAQGARDNSSGRTLDQGANPSRSEAYNDRRNDNHHGRSRKEHRKDDDDRSVPTGEGRPEQHKSVRRASDDDDKDRDSKRFRHGREELSSRHEGRDERADYRARR